MGRKKQAQLNLYIMAALLMAISVLLELVAFNHHYVWSKVSASEYSYKAFNLPYNEHFKRPLVVLDSQHLEYDLPNINQSIANVALETMSNIPSAVNILLYAKDEQGMWILMGAGKLNPADSEQNRLLLHFNESPSERAPTYKALKIVASGPVQFAMALTAVAINVPERLHLSYVRIALMWLVLMSLVWIKRYALYAVVFDESKRSHQIGNYAVMTLSVAMCTFFFWGTYPKNTLPWGFDFYGEGSYIINDSQQSLLHALPETVKDNNKAGAYEQLLSAWLKGTNRLHLYVDPALARLKKSAYDASERERQQVRFTLDRAYFKDHYYVTFGLAPLLMVYVPIYALTNMAPAPAVAMYILSLMAVLSTLWAYRALVRALVARANLLLYFTVQLAALSSSLIFFIESGISYYCLPYMAAFTWFALYLGALCSLFVTARTTCSLCAPEPSSLNSISLVQDALVYERLRERRAALLNLPQAKIASASAPRQARLAWMLGIKWQERAYLLLAGISLPMLVLSCPEALVLALTLSLPLVIALIKEHYVLPNSISFVRQSWYQRLALWQMTKDALWLLLPVLIGAALIMYYNYVRFESVFDFGVRYVLTGENVYLKSLVLGWAQLRNVLYYFFIEPLTYIKDFPFVWARLEAYDDHGTLIYHPDRIALLALPIFWSLGLALRSSKSLAGDKITKSNELLLQRIKAFKHAALLTSLGLVVVAYLCYSYAGVLSRYTSILAMAASYLALGLILLSVPSARMQEQDSLQLTLSCAPASERNVVKFNEQLELNNQEALGERDEAQGRRHRLGHLDKGTGFSTFEAGAYGFTLYVVIKSLVIGLLLPFGLGSEQTFSLGNIFNEINPSLMVDCYRIFTPWGH